MRTRQQLVLYVAAIFMYSQTQFIVAEPFRDGSRIMQDPGCRILDLLVGIISLMDGTRRTCDHILCLSQDDCHRQGGYVFVDVCLSVCLSVSNFAQKLPNGFV